MSVILPPVPNWLDVKDLLLQTLAAGLEAAGFGVQPLGAPPPTTAQPTVSLYRALGQLVGQRPLVTVMRTSGTARSAWLGNAGDPDGFTGTTASSVPSNVVPTVPIEEAYRIQIEATDQSGGMSTVDWLMGAAEGILMNTYQTFVTPTEAGGYGLYFVAWNYGTDTEDPFTETSGKVIFKNSIEFRCTRFAWGTPTPYSGTVGAFIVDVDITGLPNSQVTLDVEVPL